MIDWTQTNHVWSVESPIQTASVSTLSEGMALVNVFDGGFVKVKASAASTTQPFIGVAMMPRRTTTNTNVVQVTFPTGGGTVLLPNTVVSGSVVGAFFASTAGTEVTVSSSAASTTNIQSATDSTTGLTSLTSDATNAGNTTGVFNIVFDYTMSSAEAVARFGNPSPGFYASDVLATTGVFRIGRIAVNNYANDANWYGAADGKVKVVTGGVFTSSDGGGSSLAGIVPANVDIVSLPTPSYPWLVLDMH